MVKVPPGATVAAVGVVVGATAATGAADSPATQAIVSASSPCSSRFMNLAGYRRTCGGWPPSLSVMSGSRSVASG